MSNKGASNQESDWPMRVVLSQWPASLQCPLLADSNVKPFEAAGFWSVLLLGQQGLLLRPLPGRLQVGLDRAPSRERRLPGFSDWHVEGLGEWKLNVFPDHSKHCAVVKRFAKGTIVAGCEWSGILKPSRFWDDWHFGGNWSGFREPGQTVNQKVRQDCSLLLEES